MKRKIDKKGTLLSAIFAKKLTTWMIVLLFINLIPAVIPVVKISQASSVSWYVATTGSDSAAGDISHPFKTIQQGVNKAQPGDTVYVHGGTYKEWVQMVRSGTSGNPITLAGYPGETAIIDGTGVGNGNGFDPLVWVKAYSYLTFKDLTIQNSDAQGLGTNYDSSTCPSHDITVYGCHFKNIVSNAIYFWKQSNMASYPMYNMIVSHCSFDTIQETSSTNECVTFRGCKDSTFEYNTMTNIRQIGVDFACGSTNCVADHNTIDCSAMRSVAVGMYCDGGQSNGEFTSYITFSNNFVYGNKQLIGYCCEVGTSTIDHLTIVNNIIYSTGGYPGIIQFTDGNSAGKYQHIVIIHNTIYTTGGSCISLASGGVDAIANNIVYGGSVSASATVKTNNLATNPLFVSPGSNFHLQAGSPAIGAASSTYVSSAYHSLTDFDGKTRVTPYDIGAYEYDGEDSGNNPPTCTLTANPTSGVTPFATTFSMTATDTDSTILSWALDTNNDGTDEYSGSGIPSAIQTYTYTTTGTYTAKLTVVDDDSVSGFDTETITVTTQPNSAPNTPTKPSGPISGLRNKQYTYKTSTTDPNGNQVYYWWDWGDGKISGWLGPYNSGATVSASHKWTSRGTFLVKVKAKDSYGAESGWSATLSVTIR